MGADVNARNGFGQTPIVFACVNGHIHMAVTLYEMGANLNVIDNNGRPPISWVCLHGLRDMALELAALGADPTIQDYKVRLQSEIGHSTLIIVFDVASSRLGTSHPLPLPAHHRHKPRIV